MRLHLVKNAMLLANLISNVIGVQVVQYLTQVFSPMVDPRAVALGDEISSVFLPLSFAVPLTLVLLYEWPIRRYVSRLFRGEAVAPAERETALRRLLNEPFVLIAINLGIWCTAAGLYPLVYWLAGLGRQTIEVAFLQGFFTGLISTTVAFFVLEFVLQRRVVPVLFPDGGLSRVPGTFRIRIWTRLTAMFLAINFIPMVAFLNTSRLIVASSGQPAGSDAVLPTLIASQAAVFTVVGIWITFLISSNLTRNLEEIIAVLKNVRQGRFDQKVHVTTNDEIGYTGDVINEMTKGLAERDFIKETFGKYVTAEIRDEILAGNLALDGEMREVTVLFADLRGFTPMVAQLPPRRVVGMLNTYFKEMAAAIRQHHGLVLQYIGDEIEAVFGAPLVRSDHADLALCSAIEMQTRLHQVNADLRRRGDPALQHGIGIHTGQVVAANIGSPERLSYTLVGDTVNLASRLQGLNKRFDTWLIASADTRRQAAGTYPWQDLPETAVKGRKGKVAIHTLPGAVAAPKPQRR
jgi:adenylate cyclase